MCIAENRGITLITFVAYHVPILSRPAENESAIDNQPMVVWKFCRGRPSAALRAQARQNAARDIILNHFVETRENECA